MRRAQAGKMDGDLSGKLTLVFGVAQPATHRGTLLPCTVSFPRTWKYVCDADHDDAAHACGDRRTVCLSCDWRYIAITLIEPLLSMFSLPIKSDFAICSL